MLLTLQYFNFQVCRFNYIKSNDNQDDLQTLRFFLEHVPSDLGSSRREIKTKNLPIINSQPKKKIVSLFLINDPTRSRNQLRATTQYMFRMYISKIMESISSSLLIICLQRVEIRIICTNINITSVWIKKADAI